MDKVLKFLNIDLDALLDMGKALLITLILIFIAVRIVNFIFKRVERGIRKKGRDTAYLIVFRYVALTIVYVSFIAGFMSTVPAFNKFFSTLLAGSGLAALIFSLAAKEPIGNVVSGVIILFSKPFKTGDIIRYIDKDISGTVEEITLRHTIVRTLENKRLVIPNGLINSTSIENSTFRDHSKLCVLLDFRVTYDSDFDRAREIITEIISKHPGYVDVRTDKERYEGAPPVRVFITEFAESAVIIRAWLWVKNISALVPFRNDVLNSVSEQFRAEKINIAYPRITVITREGE